MKNFSLAFAGRSPSPDSWVDVACPSTCAEPSGSTFDAVCFGASIEGGGNEAAGPVGTPGAGVDEFLRNRQTSRTPWNLES